MFKRILVLAPHTDDGELGCGASIARFISEGMEVYYAAFSTCEKSVPKGFPPKVLKDELLRATSVLGIPKKNVIIFDYEVRRLSYHRQEILEDLVKLSKKLKPGAVFMPVLQDLHQDHFTVANEGLRAFKHMSILGYEQPWNNITFDTKCFIRLNREHIEKKVKALQCYTSQMHRNYLNKEFVFGLARTRGTQLGVEFAEAFDVVRWIL